MRYVAAYCLAALGGKTASAKDIEKILDSVGVDCDADEAKKVVSELEGKDLKNVIAEGVYRSYLHLQYFKLIHVFQVYLYLNHYYYY